MPGQSCPRGVVSPPCRIAAARGQALINCGKQFLDFLFPPVVKNAADRKQVRVGQFVAKEISGHTSMRGPPLTGWHGHAQLDYLRQIENHSRRSGYCSQAAIARCPVAPPKSTSRRNRDRSKASTTFGELKSPKPCIPWRKVCFASSVRKK